MTYDLAAIMTAAWEAHRSIGVAKLARLGARVRATRFANCLRNAWMNAKIAARKAAPVVTLRTAAVIKDEILCLECKDTLRGADWQHLDALRAELRAA